MEINVEKIIDFVNNVYGENNQILAKMTLLEMGIDVENAAQQSFAADGAKAFGCKCSDYTIQNSGCQCGSA